MAYLDRPTEAGYFIFPDLSVRHEGRYRLTFSLFETTKEEKDFDMEPSEGDLPQGVDWRMEIKTLPFSVYSAKKFPGLMESTQLSKTVADQGCRVRIRRDVRMRKRDGKSGGNYDRREEDFPRRRNGTPAAENPHSIRARSQSNSSEQRASYTEPPRRPSAVESYPPPPPAYESTPSASRHLSFGEPSAPQYPAPRQYAPQPALTPVSATPYAPAAQSPYPKPEGHSYGFPSRHLPPSCPSPAPSMKHDVYDRRQSGSTYVPPSPSLYSADGHIRRDSQASYPITPISAHPSRPLHSQTSLPSLKISSLMSPLPPIEAQLEPALENPAFPYLGGKRKHDTVFPQSMRPLHNGQRQMDSHYSQNGRGATPDDPDQGLYMRADGCVRRVEFNDWIR